MLSESFGENQLEDRTSHNFFLKYAKSIFEEFRDTMFPSFFFKYDFLFIMVVKFNTMGLPLFICDSNFSSAII